MPAESLTVTKLAELYDMDRRTLQIKFKQYNVYEAIGERKGYFLSPKQLLIAFILYQPPPGKYSLAFSLMESRGTIAELIQLWDLEKYM